MNPKVTNTDCNYFNEHLTSTDHPARKRGPCHCEWFIETLSQISFPMDTGAGRIIAKFILPSTNSATTQSALKAQVLKVIKWTTTGVDSGKAGISARGFGCGICIWKTNLVQVFTRTSSPSVFCMWHLIASTEQEVPDLPDSWRHKSHYFFTVSLFVLPQPYLVGSWAQPHSLYVGISPLITNCLVSPIAFSLSFTSRNSHR